MAQAKRSTPAKPQTEQPAGEIRPNTMPNPGRSPVDVQGMDIADVREMRERMGLNPQQMNPEPALITKQPKEPLVKFYARAEGMGIGRECLLCGKKRRFSMVVCPSCGSLQHRQTKVKSVDEAEAKEAAAEAIKHVTNAVPPFQAIPYR